MKKPVVLSTGGGNLKEINASVKILKKNKTNFSLYIVCLNILVVMIG